MTTPRTTTTLLLGDRALRSLAVGLLLGASSLLGGCLNDCQRLCNEMADYWEECGKSFGDSEAADCRSNYADGTDKLEQYEPQCRTLMSTATNSEGANTTFLRAEYSCEDMLNGPGGAFGG